MFYEGEDLDNLARETIRGLAAETETPAGYTNYDPQPEKSGAAKRAFGTNYARLQQVKRKYDPDRVFNKWFPIEPAAED